ncbi:response regulator [Pseudomonas arsenicoxydans]|uniref:Response regulator n=1 Tax=Pseudomonas arsenicoxydans TaxID=702115 RepID=A0A502GTB4_9PSED|nr:response regulator [Pseudomonas arsenicoxydans]TPG64658.1 response regulator [Pseudomonas arsenicoxydans]
MPEHRLLLVDDHGLVREGLRGLLEDVKGISVIGEAGNGHEAIALCRELHPDIVLMDLSMPLLDGVSAVTMIRARWPAIRILALTANISESNAAFALDSGAHGYLLKRSRLNVLLMAIERVAAGLTFIDPEMNSLQVQALRINSGKTSAGSSLTGRERQILKLIAEGARNRDISALLSISLKTVETHRLNLMRKLDAHNAADLTQCAFRFGLLVTE